MQVCSSAPPGSGSLSARISSLSPSLSGEPWQGLPPGWYWPAIPGPRTAPRGSCDRRSRGRRRPGGVLRDRPHSHPGLCGEGIRCRRDDHRIPQPGARQRDQALQPGRLLLHTPQQEAVEAAIRGSPDWRTGRGRDPRNRVRSPEPTSPHRGKVHPGPAREGGGGLRNGAASGVTPALLTLVGAKVVALHWQHGGTFARPSEPLAENLPYMGEMIRKTGADCGIAHDGDADRMVAWDNRGRYIDGDRMFTLPGTVRGCPPGGHHRRCSMSVEAVGEVHRTPVGDAYVSEHLRDWGISGGNPPVPGSSRAIPSAPTGSMPRPSSAPSPRGRTWRLKWTGSPGTPCSGLPFRPPGAGGAHGPGGCLAHGRDPGRTGGGLVPGPGQRDGAEDPDHRRRGHAGAGKGVPGRGPADGPGGYTFTDRQPARVN